MIQMLQLGCSRAKGVYTRWVEAQTFPVRVEKIDWLPRQLVRSQLQRSYYLCMCLIRLCCLRLHRKLFDRSSKDKQGPGKNIFLCLLMMIICQAANRREVQVFFLDCFLWILIHVRKRNIRGSHKTIHLQMDVGGVRTFVCETKYVHACGNYASESSLSLSPFCSCFASVYGHNLLCVCVQSHAQWPHLLSLSSDVYLEQCSSEIKGQKRRVVCSFISAPSDGGWQFLQLTPPDVFTAVGMCAVYVYVCVCVFSLTLDLLLYLIFPTVIFFSQLTVSHPLAPLALQ